MNVNLTRRVSFCAAHSYWIPELSEDENRALFGRWARSEGHGHNYILELTVGGEIDPKTGMVVNITAIDEILRREIVARLDGKFLNREVTHFRTTPTSLEMIVRFAHERIVPFLPARVAFVSLRLFELPTFWSDYEEVDGLMVTSLTRSYEFSASHRLHSNALTDEENRSVFGKCDNLNGHGHNYVFEVTLSGEPDKRTGMLYDLDSLDTIVDQQVISAFDHKHLNLDTPDFRDTNPTSEMLAIAIWQRLALRLPTAKATDTGHAARLSRVVVRETARNSFEYRGD